MSLNITHLTANSVKLLSSMGVGEKLPRVVSSTAPIATLIQPLKEWYNHLVSKQDAYDNIALGLESVCDAVADDLLGKVDLPNYSVESDEHDVIEIDQDDFDALFAGLNDARNKLSPNSPILSITSTTGLVYSLQFDEESRNISCVTAYGGTTPIAYMQEGKCYLRENWPANINDTSGYLQSNNIVSHVQRICDKLRLSVTSPNIDAMMSAIESSLGLEHESSIYDSIASICDHYSLQFTNCLDGVAAISSHLGVGLVPANSHAVESVTTIASSLIAGATLNSDIVEVLDSIFNGRCTQFFSGLDVSGHLESSQKFLGNCKRAFINGGATGVISYLYSVIKTVDSIIDEDGLFVFTDNSSQMPKEFIAGAVSGILSSTISAIGMALTVITPIVGAIVNVIGSITWSILGSFNQTFSSTRASLYVPLNDDDAASLVDACPVAFLQGENSISNRCFSWYKDFYLATKLCAYVSVPGGYLFVGPGEIDDDGTLRKVRYEFHPLAQIIKPEKWSQYFQYASFFPALIAPSLSDATYARYYIYKNPDDVARDWFNLYNDEDAIAPQDGNEASSGYLSGDDDTALLCSTFCCAGVFLYWLWCLNSGWMSSEYSESNDFAYCFYRMSPAAGDGTDASLGRIMYHFCYMQNNTEYSTGASAGSPAWQDIVKGGLRTQGSVWAFGGVYKISNYGQTDDKVLTFVRNGYLYGSNPHLEETVSELRSIADIQCWNLGSPITLPSAPKYTLSIPNLNSRTFWLWAATAIAATTAILVGTVVFAVKFNKWRKKKVTTNALDNQNKRTEYQNALGGQRWDDDQQKMVSFDVNSEEGQQYINSCYTSYYKQTRKANFMSNLIGGSKFDTTSFYGDGAVDESVDDGSTTEKLKSLFAQSDEDMNTNAVEQNSDPNLLPVVRLIKGFPLSE